MSPQTPTLSAQKPPSSLTQPLKFDFKDLATALVKGVGHAALGKFDDLTDDGADALAAIGLEGKTPEALLYLLLQRALQQALVALLKDSRDHLPEKINPDDLLACMEEAITSVEIDSAFFLKPAQLPLLHEVSRALQNWLSGAGVALAIATTIAQRLPGFFPYALHREWQRNAKQYAAILDRFTTPFTQAAEREAAWHTYAAQLQQCLDEGVFNEPFGLRQIYIPLNAFYEEEIPKTGAADEPGRKKRRVVVELAQELETWLNKNDRNDAIRVVSGGPGSGKSSFAKVFAARIAEQGRLKVLFVPLHLIDSTRDFIDEIGRFVHDDGQLKNNPLDADGGEANLLIILDGLDELASQGRAAAATARDFVRTVQQTVERRNLHQLQLRVLFSGREVVVQESESEFRRPHQVLTVLPYYVASPEEEFYDPQRLLKKDLRQIWWQNYGRLIGKNFAGLPKELKREDLVKITAQPLLNYLLALSFCRGKLDFASAVTLNQIYHDLIEAVYERGYENGRRHVSVRGLPSEDFFLILEEIGLAAWHGDGRTTTVTEIEKHCRDGGFGNQLDAFQDGAKRGITRLLAAFFFRQHGERVKGDPTFVFTHKSFGEYLAARRLVRAMQDVVEELTRRETTGRGKGWGEIEALHHWAIWCGPTAISPYIHQFLVAEVSAMTQEKAAEWQRCFTRLFSYLLRHGMPMERLQLPCFQDALFQSRNAEEALLAALNACARATRQVSRVEPPNRTCFGAWFKRIQGQRSGSESVLAARCLSWLDLSDSILDFCDLYAADLSNAELINIQVLRGGLWDANLNGADLRRANLSGADLRRADLRRAKLSGANLSGADLSEADLRRADLRGADLSEADLRRADLCGADLRGADLSGANLSEARLSGADLSGADLRNAKITGTNFQNAILGNAKFDTGKRPR
ncbi:MAG: pentapeptide repeat-containing protein [Sulfuricellaceae bacterium]